jgi:mono/diheme cytochrome c family protein
MDSRFYFHIAALVSCVVFFAGCAREPAQVSYAKDVAPLLEKYCQSCHLPGQIGYDSSGFSVSDYDSLMKGTKYGPVVLAGDPLNSAMVMLIEGRVDSSIKMPHAGAPALSQQQIDTIRLWVEQGARNN